MATISIKKSLLSILLSGAGVGLATASRIIGGSPASKDEFPTFVNPNILDDSQGLCGGTLIHSDIVLTAAHCAAVWSVGDEVYVGGTSITGTDADYTVNVNAHRLHPQYQTAELTTVYDFMVFRIDQELTSASVQTLAAANGSLDPPGDATVTAIGLGDTSNEDDFTLTLLKVNIEVYDEAKCSDTFSCIVDRLHLCAGSDEGGEGVCFGDSGGPLFYNNVQVGIASYVPGSGCALAGKASVFARISEVRDWIDEQVCDLSTNPPASCNSGRQRRQEELEEDNYDHHEVEEYGMSYANDRGLLEPSLFFFLCRNRVKCPVEE